MTKLTGSCRCGQVRLAVRGNPLRVGICHCTDCRQESGSAFTYFGIWSSAEFEYEGETSEFAGREFCARCGSRVFALNEEEVEMKLGVLTEAPTRLTPTHELWTKRREPWLTPIEGAEQYEEDRP
ncbi:GFA family protein [Rhizobium sp. P40RR-XXII]|uniref:GFA family protein n=1 Tax=Rhizobium sp. P40RR-XXII TaxID=2726739 RepID=UPI001457253F|nr:GFA family protein [Rhizobium sp. P40RR-XXII]NLS17814.1 GFA family protein [Rhizobium sp. P40RR-XXII]